ncbi:hypothetical protein OpiT1DRAFT_00771 [Opitutaceae bacterium TAV1]|nr:hypothetical protein OpiT1DRAFT_00771 [Opitutaceae bacterium TAV1]
MFLSYEKFFPMLKIKLPFKRFWMVAIDKDTVA